MAGILLLAYKLLVNDRATFSGLLVGLTFSVFLMIKMTSPFAGKLTLPGNPEFRLPDDRLRLRYLRSYSRITSRVTAWAAGRHAGLTPGKDSMDQLPPLFAEGLTGLGSGIAQSRHASPMSALSCRRRCISSRICSALAMFLIM
jgi:hypothetical protein